MAGRGWSKFKGREEEFRAAWADINTRVVDIAARFGVNEDTVYNHRKRLGLPPRMPILEQLGLPPFGKRRKVA